MQYKNQRTEKLIKAFGEIIKQVTGSDEYDVYKEQGKEWIAKLKGEEDHYDSSDSTLLPNMSLPNS